MQLLTWVRVAIGYVFITSGIVKLLVPSFQEFFAQLGLPFPSMALLFIALIEIGCGAFLIANMYVKYAVITLVLIMLGALLIAKLPILMTEGILSFVFESRLDITMLILLILLWKFNDHVENVTEAT